VCFNWTGAHGDDDPAGIQAGKTAGPVTIAWDAASQVNDLAMAVLVQWASQGEHL